MVEVSPLDAIHGTLSVIRNSRNKLFFRQIVAGGGKIALPTDAMAVEAVSPKRLCTRYMLSRSFRQGNTLSLYDRLTSGRADVLTVRATKAVGRVALDFAGLLPMWVLFGKAGIVHALSGAARELGMIAGLTDYVYQEYKRTGDGR